VGALLLHIAVKAPQIANPLAAPKLDADGPDRRAFVVAVGAAVGAVTLTTVGQSVTPLKELRPVRAPPPRPRPTGLPVNRTAAAAGITAERLTGWRLRVDGPRPYELTLDELRGMRQHSVVLPIACVEGWSKSAHWTGVRITDLLDRAGALPGAQVRVTSMQRHGAYAVMEMAPPSPRPAHPARPVAQRADPRSGPRLPCPRHRPEPAGRPADQVVERLEVL